MRGKQQDAWEAFCEIYEWLDSEEAAKEPWPVAPSQEEDPGLWYAFAHPVED